MPHVIVKLWPGKSEQQKTQLTEGIVKAVTSTLHYGDDSVSVSLEEVEPEDWTEKVYKPDIAAPSKWIFTHWGSARVSRVGEAVPGSRTFSAE